MGTVSSIKLREISEKGLLLLTITIPEMEVLCWSSIPTFIHSLMEFHSFCPPFVVHPVSRFPSEFNQIFFLTYTAAYFMALFTENDHSKEVYWCNCNGRSF